MTNANAASSVKTQSPTTSIKSPVLFRAGSSTASFQQRLMHSEANLQFLNCGQYRLTPGSKLQELSLPERESLLFMWNGHITVQVQGKEYDLMPYDTLYVPRGAEFLLRNTSDGPACAIQMSAPAENVHPVFHSQFSEWSQREDRIRHLKGKDVYMMFDVSEPADKLIAGYTFFRPFTRSWPPHNHTDQEEIYFFTKGNGSMEVYESPETLSFVHNVTEGDIVSIPLLNYHPVFTQESPLEFIWCIAGERYWVGDKNKSFMTGTGPALTT